MLSLIENVDARRGRYACSCGEETVAWKSNVSTGHTRSCGCLRRAVTSARARTHGHKAGGKRTRVYATWADMKSRCENSRTKSFKDYGGRGIAVCERWQSFENFLADMGEPPTGMTLDRREVDGPYCKDNCRWATRVEQMNNKRTNHVIAHAGESMTLAQWAERSGVAYHTLLKRIQRGVPVSVSISKSGYLRWPGNDSTNALLRLA